MERDGLIKRRPVKKDKRITEIIMTPKARETLVLVKSIGQRIVERAVSGLEPETIDTVTRTLKAMRENLTRSPYAPANSAGRSHARATGPQRIAKKA